MTVKPFLAILAAICSVVPMALSPQTRPPAGAPVPSAAVGAGLRGNGPPVDATGSTVAASAEVPTSIAVAADALLGVWRNHKDSVHVRVHPCADALCGTVIWANETAQADARNGGTRDLVGAELFRDLKMEKPDIWRGQVFVPDIGRTMSMTITVVDRTTIRGRGCLFWRIGCKSKIWVRVE